LPEGGGGSFIGSVVAAAGNTDWPSHKRKEASSTLPAPPAKRKKKVEKEQQQQQQQQPPKPPQNPPRQQKKAKYPRERTPEYYLENGAPLAGGHMGMGASTADDQVFFEKVKRTLDNRETYDEFLKLVNLFSQDIIDMRTLVDKSNYFLGDGSDLSIQFRRIVGWEERERLFREPDDPLTGGLKNLAIYVPHNKDDLHHKCGPSYRRIPVNVSIDLVSQHVHLPSLIGGTHCLLRQRRTLPIRFERRMGFTSNLGL
jgi:paired amphipathic helix protein Sin3a